MNGFDDFDTTITAEEFYSEWTHDEADYIASTVETTDEPPYDYDDLAYDEDTGSPIDTDRMERESRWMDDLSDDGDALASAGFGTDEDYGYYGDDF